VPKLKTKKGAAKRFQVTKRGKIKRKKAGTSHILTKKSPKRKRRLGRPDLVDKSDKKIIKKLIPYK
jgi:large subunit ribosomal protein L35